MPGPCAIYGGGTSRTTQQRRSRPDRERALLRIVAISFAASLSIGPVAATPLVDLGGLPICAKLTKMPPACAPIARGARNAYCRFALTRNGRTIEHLVTDGLVVTKRVVLRAGPGGDSFGVRRGMSPASAARSIQATIVTATRYWPDAEDSDAAYLQSGDIACAGTRSYRVYVWFRHGAARSVSVSTLPPF